MANSPNLHRFHLRWITKTVKTVLQLSTIDAEICFALFCCTFLFPVMIEKPVFNLKFTFHVKIIFICKEVLKY